jgi:hypothetical protein
VSKLSLVLLAHERAITVNSGWILLQQGVCTIDYARQIGNVAEACCAFGFSPKSR